MGKTRRMRKLLVGLLALLCLGAALEDKMVSLGGVSPGMSAAEVEKVKGQPDRVVQGDLLVFDHGLVMVRLKDDRVVYVAGFDLEQSGRSMALKGVAREYARRRLGEPGGTYLKGEVTTWLYPAGNADVGVMVSGSSVAGFVLQEPGTLGATLKQAGYLESPGQR